MLTYDAKRIGRTQPAFWSFVGLCRDNGITVLDSAGTDLTSSVMGGVDGMLAEMDRDATVARLAAGKAHWRGTRRVEGRWPYGEHPSHEYDAERSVVDSIQAMRASGTSSYAIARTLNAEGTRTRYGKEFTTTTVQNVCARPHQGLSQTPKLCYGFPLRLLCARLAIPREIFHGQKRPQGMGRWPRALFSARAPLSNSPPSARGTSPRSRVAVTTGETRSMSVIACLQQLRT